MSKPETDETTLESPPVDTPDAEPTETEEPAPEPWTPERVIEWNRYYDFYVAGAVLLLVFLGSAHKIVGSAIWTQLQSGRQTIERTWPLVTDIFSYTETGKTWVNIPWLFEVVNAGIFDLVSSFFKDPLRAEQVAAGTLVVVNATIRALTALVLMRIRRPGPGLWWSAICVALAVGGMLVPAPIGQGIPLGFSLGGIAGVAEVDSETWGLLLLAVELATLHAIYNLGRHKALNVLPVLFLLWANIDESFLIGLLVLAAYVVGGMIGVKPIVAKNSPIEDHAPPSAKRALAILGISAVACLINPSFYKVYPAALTPFLILLDSTADMTADQLSYFGPKSRELFDRAAPHASNLYVAFYIVTLGAVLASFFLNRRRFKWGRFLSVAVMALLWACLRRMSAEFALVAAPTLALNGQEWYLDRFGERGRLGTGWTIWSIGGRLVTLAAIFALIVVKGLMGFGVVGLDLPVGLGVDPDEFAFEAADYLKNAKIQGKVLNLGLSQGDALIWRAWRENHDRKTFIDSRKHLFPRELRQVLRDFRQAARENEPEKWKPVYDQLDALGISAVMLAIRDDQATYNGLARNPDWVEFYDDGKIVMFGRLGAKASADAEFFNENKLDADSLVYGNREVRIPSVQSPPSAVTWLDRFFRSRANQATQPHSLAADRWLGMRWPENPDITPPDPAHCLMAIREARTALAHNPDDPAAFRILDRAYDYLTRAEAQVLSRSPSGTPSDYLTFRFRQRVAALTYAIQTTPPPTEDADRDALAVLNLELADLFRSMSYLDLERDRLEAARELTSATSSGTADLFTERHRERLFQLDEQLDQLTSELDGYAVDRAAGPLELAAAALQRGMPKYAITKLSQADEQGVSLATVKWQLFDLYCMTGQPEKAFDLVANVDDPALSTGPGSSSHRQGLASLLIGDYENAQLLWRDHSLNQLRGSQAMQALGAIRQLLQGEPKGATVNDRELPGEINQEAEWEAELGLSLLESGPSVTNAATRSIDAPAATTLDTVADHFTRALKLRPNIPTRALLVYYLEKMGKPIPAATEEKAATKAEEKPATSKPGEAPSELPKDPFQSPKEGKPEATKEVKERP